MNFVQRIATLLFLAVLTIGIGNAQQNLLTQTSLSAAISATAQTFPVASATNITTSPATLLYVEREAMLVLAVSGTTITVARGQVGTPAVAHPSAEMVLAGRPDYFATTAPSGACTTATVYASPYINISTGLEWLCSSITLRWVPGFQNSLAPPEVTAAVASAAGLITPSGPLFHITGALAITGFNIPVGFRNGGFCVIPDGTFTTTTANNIALASTAVVNKTLCWTFEGTTSKFVPSY